jgi:transglutaminase-like putative cysteine protease
MSIRVACHHVTRYLFDRSVNLSPHILRLRPAPHCRTPILSYSMKVKPQEHFINWQQDAFGNYLARLVFPEKSRELTIDIEVIADMTSYNPFDFFVEEYADNYPFSYSEQEQQELIPYLKCEDAGPLLQAWLDQVDRTEINTIDFLVELNQRLQQHINSTFAPAHSVQHIEITLTF